MPPTPLPFPNQALLANAWDRPIAFRVPQFATTRYASYKGDLVIRHRPGLLAGTISGEVPRLSIIIVENPDNAQNPGICENGSLIVEWAQVYEVFAASPRFESDERETIPGISHLIKLGSGAPLMLIRALFGIVILGCAIFAISLVGHRANAASTMAIPAAKVDQSLASEPGKESAVFAGGCFWGTQAVFERVKGVLHTTVGYAGGSAATATYDQVTTETTGHAESVEVIYDPSKITYGQLLRIFFSVAHDPTQLNRQGPDVGSSYRSAIFYVGDNQKRIANAYISQLDDAKVFRKRIVTEVTPLKGFYRAEDYHQDYALHHPENPYIQVCDRPKIESLKQQFPDLFVDYESRH